MSYLRNFYEKHKWGIMKTIIWVIVLIVAIVISSYFTLSSYNFSPKQTLEEWRAEKIYNSNSFGRFIDHNITYDDVGSPNEYFDADIYIYTDYKINETNRCEIIFNRTGFLNPVIKEVELIGKETKIEDFRIGSFSNRGQNYFEIT